MSPPIAVIGGTGLAGRATVEALLARGRSVRVIARHPAARPGVELVAADASDPASLARALEGAEAAVLCARPDYWRWPTELVPMVEAAAEAGRRAGARLVYCDNLYGYGVPEGPLTEASPLRPHGPKGRARVAAAQALLRAHEAGTVQVAIGRAADFYGPGAEYPNLKLLFGAALQGAPVRLLAPGDLPHSVSFLGDVGAGLATLALAPRACGQVWHLPVAPPTTERAFAERVVALAGSSSKVSVVPAWAVDALYAVSGLFSPTMRELPEVQYQHRVPFVVDDGRFVREFGVRAIDQDRALRLTLDFWRGQLGLPASPAGRAA